MFRKIMIALSVFLFVCVAQVGAQAPVKPMSDPDYSVTCYFATLKERCGDRYITCSPKHFHHLIIHWNFFQEHLVDFSDDTLRSMARGYQRFLEVAVKAKWPPEFSAKIRAHAFERVEYMIWEMQMELVKRGKSIE